MSTIIDAPQTKAMRTANPYRSQSGGPPPRGGLRRLGAGRRLANSCTALEWVVLAQLRGFGRAELVNRRARSDERLLLLRARLAALAREHRAILVGGREHAYPTADLCLEVR